MFEWGSTMNGKKKKKKCFHFAKTIVNVQDFMNRLLSLQIIKDLALNKWSGKVELTKQTG